MSWKVFAEDSGTGLTDQKDRDWADGANLSAHAHSPNQSDFSVSPPSIDYSPSVPEVTLGKAQYRVTVENVSTRSRQSQSVEWLETTFVILSPETTLGLTDNALNDVYVRIDLQGNPDEADYVVSDTEPTLPSVKVAEIDTTNDSIEKRNVYPDADYESVTFSEQREFIYDEVLDTMVVIYHNE